MRLARFWCGWLGVIVTASGAALAQSGSASQQSPAKHPFAAKDWVAMHSAGAAAITSDGTILYQVNFGGDAGPTHKEWWTVSPDGSHSKKLTLPEGFSPRGFTHDGQSLYGTWKVNKLGQLAIFPVKNGEAAAVPSTVVLLPRGIQSATPSPDGKHFAIVADPRSPDPLEDVRHVQEPDQTSLYVVNVDGTSGQWWCGNLKGISEIAWNGDATSLALLSPSPRIGRHDVSTGVDVCSATGARHVADIPNSASGIAWAEGGREIAFLSTKSAVLTPEHVWTVPSAGGAPEDRTSSLDGTALQLGGDARGHLWVLVDRGVRNEVDEFQNGALKPAYRWPEGVLSGVPVSAEYPSAASRWRLPSGIQLTRGMLRFRTAITFAKSRTKVTNNWRQRISVQ